jgi:hypothetical protein
MRIVASLSDAEGRVQPSGKRHRSRPAAEAAQKAVQFGAMGMAHDPLRTYKGATLEVLGPDRAIVSISVGRSDVHRDAESRVTSLLN